MRRVEDHCLIASLAWFRNFLWWILLNSKFMLFNLLWIFENISIFQFLLIVWIGDINNSHTVSVELQRLRDGSVQDLASLVLDWLHIVFPLYWFNLCVNGLANDSFFLQVFLMLFLVEAHNIPVCWTKRDRIRMVWPLTVMSIRVIKDSSHVCTIIIDLRLWIMIWIRLPSWILIHLHLLLTSRFIANRLT